MNALNILCVCVCFTQKYPPFYCFQIWAVLMAVVVIIAMFILSWESTSHTRIDSRTEEQKETLKYFFGILGYGNSSDNATHSGLQEAYSKLHPGLWFTLASCYVLITLEIILRIISCTSVRRYLKNPIHICEMLGAFAFWMKYFVLELYLENFKSMPGFLFYMFVQYLVLLQVTRLIRIARHSMAFNIMSLSIRSSLPEICVLFALLLVLVSVFGWLMFAVEYRYDKFDSCFTGMYWALITLTTVGYGDYYPDTITGHVIAGVCAVCGVVTLAMPIGVIASSFSSYYSYHKDVSCHLKRHTPPKTEE